MGEALCAPRVPWCRPVVRRWTATGALIEREKQRRFLGVFAGSPVLSAFHDVDWLSLDAKAAA